MHRRVGVARFESLAAFVDAEIGATPPTTRLNEPTKRRILAETGEVLRAYRSGSMVDVPVAGLIVIARRE